MSEICIDLPSRDLADIAKLARSEVDGGGSIGAVTVEEMAAELLRAYLVLVRDCPNILPARAVKFKASPGAGKVAGKRGVSVGGGVNV